MALRTGEVARLAGVSVETLRFYERSGILPEPPRRASGFRAYPPETVDLIRFVKRAQELGFSLRQVRALLELREAPRRARAQVPQLVEAQLDDIAEKIRDLEAIRGVLEEMLCTCRSQESPASCPIIESLSGAGPPRPE